jgi:hypothetical protein
MVGFGPKQAWLAIRDGDPVAVIAALGFRDLGPVGWRTGIEVAHLSDDRVAVTPPLPGAGGHNWVLVVGRGWFTAHLDHGIAALSEQLGTEVQFFSTYRVTERHRWERAVDGVMVRAFEHVGETGETTLWWGDPDSHERALGLPAEEPDADDDGLILGGLILGESDVMRLAAAWSVDPSGLDGLPAPGRLHAAAM